MSPLGYPSQSSRARNVALFSGAIAAVVVLIALSTAGVLRSTSHSGPVEFVGSHAAADYTIAGDMFTNGSQTRTALGPIHGSDGGSLFATLAMAPRPPVVKGMMPPVVITAPQPVWNLYAGVDASAPSLGSGRPLGATKSGTLFALTAQGLVAYVKGNAVPVIGASTDLVGALSADGIVAVKDPATPTTDVYAIDPSTYKANYLGSITANPLALAFASDGTLFVLTQGDAVWFYSIAAGHAPTLTGRTTLPNPWP